jgi:hypothetical protein
MSRPRGGFIGHNPAPAASAINSAAGGIWTLREAEALKRAGTWPRAFVDPASVSGLQLWLDASDASTLYDATSGGSLVAADGAVARWEDKSGNARHATQATAGKRPVRKTSIQNSKDVLRFTAANAHGLQAGSTSTWKFLHDGTASYAVVVAKCGASADPNALHTLLETGGISSDIVGFYMGYDDRTGSSRNNALFVSTARGVLGDYQSLSIDNDKVSANTYAIIETLVSANASASSRLRSRVNGGSQFGANTITAAASTANSTYALNIGTTPLLASFDLTGDICEILLFSQQPSSEEQTVLRDYLATKWGITLA